MRLEAPRRRRAALGLAPLIDVVFILLLFFMLTTRFGHPQAMAVRVPGEGGAPGAAEIDLATLRLHADGAVTLPGGARVDAPSLRADPTVAALVAAAAPVRLEVDDEADLQGVVRLLDRLEAIGLVDVVVGGLGR